MVDREGFRFIAVSRVLHNVTGNRDVNKHGPFAAKAAVLVSL